MTDSRRDRLERPALDLRLGDDLSAYRSRVDEALREGRDVWGEAGMAAPDGPSFDAVAPYLTPLALGDRVYLSDSGMHYILMAEPLDGDSFALHVADGSQIVVEYTNRWGAPEWAVDFPTPPRGAEHVVVYDFLVGADADEQFGTRLESLDQPQLDGGWLPILQVGYEDNARVRFQRESFVTRDRVTGDLWNYVRFTAVQAPSEVRPTVTVVRGGHDAERESRVEFEVATGTSQCLRCLNADGDEPVQRLADAEYDRAKLQCTQYWHDVLAGGASIEVPDAYLLDALRNVLIQNLILGERYSVGNPYETTFLMEAHEAVLSLLRFGFTERATECLDRLATMTNGAGPEWYESWERGTKLAAAAEHWRLTGSRVLLDRHGDRYLEYVDDFGRQRLSDPHGLLAPERYAWDIPEPVYGWHSQAVAWRGARDVLNTLADVGRIAGDDTRFHDIEELRDALLDATNQSVTILDDGSAFVPVALFADEEPYDFLTGTRRGNYWNLVAPYALATGLVPPKSELARRLFQYMAAHGAWLLGLTRFNGLYDPPTPIGSWREDGTAGYCAPGIDNAFGVQTLPFLADNDEADRLALALYAKLAHGMTRGTFVDGEVTTIGVVRDEFFRSTWYPPNGTSNSAFLDALRLVLLRERLEETGRPREIDLAWATPRWWLSDGQTVAVTELPTSFGPISYRIASHVEAGYVEIDVVPPSTPAPICVHVRLPSGYVLRDDGTADGSSTVVRLDERDGPYSARLAVEKRRSLAEASS